MAKRISLEEIKKLLEKGKADTDLLKDVDAFMGLIVFFAPMAVGLPPGTADVIVEVLGEREALIKAGERLVEKLAKLGGGDEVDRYRRIEASHLLTMYSAFFDSVSKNIPDFWKKLALDEAAQKYLTKQATGKEKMFLQARPPAPPLPHPLTTFSAHLAELQAFYQALSKILAEYLDALKIVNIDAADKAKAYKALGDSIVDQAIERYQAQYVELAKKFPEFHIYANFHFQAAVDERLRGLAEVSDSTRKEVDIGFQKLAEAVERLGRKPANRALADLRKRYENNSRKPVSEKGVPGLTFPRRSDIFLPQAYRALRYRTGTRLDDDEVWKSAPVHQDLGPFLTRCLESPYTMEKPILILGAPGSGKSMLTHMIGSVLGGRFDTVRVELNKVHADSRIHSQIEEFVLIETQGRRISWPELREEFTAPPVVILDGFDELLQATGQIFAAYLEDCAEFQADSMGLDRPVRTIITSRVTLINRAHVPEDTIVIRLEEFDNARQREWNEIWNRHNQEYFADPAHHTQPFDVKTLHADVRALARQPLLLLMLALYDANQNRLATRGDWNRTALYHSLIRDFVEREEKRAEKFDDLPDDEQNERIEKQMRRLGVAGLAMFNRRKREIRRVEVEEALAAFQLSYPAAAEGQPLSQAERLFGSFFFVLKSETVQSSDIAYEFLHPTFGEFLAAYTIARELEENCENILGQKRVARHDYVRKPDAFPNTWFECLIHAPLFSEPVVLSMLNEWLPQIAGERVQSVLNQLEAVVEGQALMLLEGVRFPDTFKPLPALGHAAIYSANLFTVAAVLKKTELIFDEKKFRSFPDEARPWDRLASLWRSWFSLRVLANLGAVFTARREGDQVRIKASGKIEAQSKREVGLGRLYAAASGLGDHVLLGLAGYFLADSVKNSRPTLDEVDAYLKSEGYTLGVFSKFRRIPLSHSQESRAKLLAIVADPFVPNWEIWLRAIWIATTDPNSSVAWSNIMMVRELHNSCEHLIAAVASPEDAEAFYSQYGTRPVQLTFAKKSGGKQRYRETYDRLLKLMPDADWTVEEYSAMRDAANYFGETETAKSIGKIIEKQGGAWRSVWVRNLPGLLGYDPLSFLPLSLPLLFPTLSLFPVTPAGIMASAIVKRSWGSVGSWGITKGLNPYQSGYAEFVRLAKTSKTPLVTADYLAKCVDLPADVQIELMDYLRTQPQPAQDPKFLKQLEFPMDRIGQITLDSLASARRVADWLGAEEALREIDHRIVQDAPPIKA